MYSRLPLVALIIIAAVPHSRAADEGAAARLRKDLEYLTSDECEGRGAATQGLFKAAQYIVAEFKRLGLKPGGTDGYFQPFKMQAGKAQAGSGRLMLKGPLGQEIDLKQDVHFRALGFAPTATASAPLVFAGYGVSHAESKYDDYQGLDVTGKIVVVLRKTPPTGKDGKPFAGGGNTQNQLGSLSNKLLTASSKKAAGVLVVNDLDTAAKGDVLMAFDYTSAETPPVNIPSAHITRAQLDALFVSSTGRTLADTEREINRRGEPRSTQLTGWSATLDSGVIRRFADVPNVIGIREGRGPLAKEYVVIGAHYDHLGRGERGSTERDEKKKQQLHRGADDNGSGTVALLELARRFAGDPNYEGRSLVFMTFAGEEQGLLGSKYYCNKPTIPLEQVASMLNLDMVGRLRPDKGKTKGKLEVGGVGSAKEFSPLVDELNKKYDFDLAKSESAYGPSDHTSFAEKKVPVFFFFTGLHQEYHKPADTIDTINFDGMKKIVDFGTDLVRHLGQMPKPAFVQTKRATGSFSGNVPRIGIMPGNYGDSDKGVLIGGITAGGPAAKAGIKEGDVIIEIAGKPVKNMTAYMSVMGLQKKGQSVEFLVERSGKQVKLKVVPE